MRRMNLLGIALAALPLFSGVSCAQTGDTRRELQFERDGRWAGYGVSYGPHREGQSPGGEQPTEAQLREDLTILDQHFDLIRVYGSGVGAETMLRIIRDDGLGLRVMLGAWLGRDQATPSQLAGEAFIEGEPLMPDEESLAANRVQISEVIRLANAYPDEVWAVNVGNETRVWWTSHPVTIEHLIEYLREVREAVQAPVTTADDYNFWNREESKAVAAECDFIALHAYAMWNKQLLDDAVGWTDEQYRAVRELHGDEIPIVITEAGWATGMVDYGQQSELILGEPGFEQQTEFTKAFLEWATKNRIAHFLFEAFDEPWKGGDDPAEVEKHWGMWFESREPKAAARWLMEHGPKAETDSGG